MDTFDPTRPFRPWFLRIVANLARNDRRARGRRAQLDVRAATADARREVATPEDIAVSDAERRRVVEALNRLDRDDRLVVALRYFEQLSEAEMAETLGCPPGTVKSRLSRANGQAAQRTGARGSVPWLRPSPTPGSRPSS